MRRRNMSISAGIVAVLVAALTGVFQLAPPPGNGAAADGAPAASRASVDSAAPGNYFDVLPVFWSQVYGAGGETLYCGEPFASRKGGDINVEHVFPMAWVMNKLGCRDRDQCRADNAEFRRIESDLHNLYPSRRDINRIRGSFPFGMIPGEQREYGACDFEFDRQRRRVEPRPAARGDIARAMFYMHETYDLLIRQQQARLLQRWNREDPPGAAERRRNDVIEQLQGNRNRFVDEPRAVDELSF